MDLVSDQVMEALISTVFTMTILGLLWVFVYGLYNSELPASDVDYRKNGDYKVINHKPQEWHSKIDHLRYSGGQDRADRWSSSDRPAARGWVPYKPKLIITHHPLDSNPFKVEISSYKFNLVFTCFKPKTENEPTIRHMVEFKDKGVTEFHENWLFVPKGEYEVWVEGVDSYLDEVSKSEAITAINS